MLRDSTAVAVVVVRTRPRAIPLAMVHMRKSFHGFPSVPLYGYGAPPELRYEGHTTEDGIHTNLLESFLLSCISCNTGMVNIITVRQSIWIN